eukprot:COSAG04_NODE_12359_length_656_cov_4.150808_1_plen_62_part_10
MAPAVPGLGGAAAISKVVKMAVSEGRSLREALRKLGAAEPRRLRAQLGTGGGPAVRSELEFA